VTEPIIFFGCFVVGIGLFGGALSASVEGPWWRRSPIPGQYWDLPSIGPVRVLETTFGSVRFVSASGEEARANDKAFRWQATLTTREAFETAIIRERVMKGGTP
jgi:hypothetical protein